MELTAPAALWLWPLAVAVLLALQLIRSRRREVHAGSLMIWRRVAARDASPPPRMFVFDRAFFLQAAVLLCVMLAWAGPALRSSGAPGRRVVLLLDNGPTARARDAGTPLWTKVRERAAAALDGLGPNDRVLLVASAPRPRYLDAGGAENGAASFMAVARAKALLDELTPSLSGPRVEEAWAFALQAARGSNGHGGAGEVQAVAISPREAPAEAGAAGRWVRIAPASNLANVALTAFGSRWTADEQGRPVAEVLVQVRAFGERGGAGEVVVGTEESPDLLPARAVRLDPRATKGVAFTLPHDRQPRALRIAWRFGEDFEDALPEDEAIVAVRRAPRAAAVRFHGEAPRVKDLFERASQAQVLDGQDEDAAADLEVYVESLPEELPADARAILLLAPPAAYEAFDLGAAVLENVRVLPGEKDPLTEGMAAGPEGLGVRVAKARELLAAGDMDVLWRDEEDRPLAIRFRLRDRRVGYALAFVPGDGPAGAKLPPPLAALLVRMLEEARGAGAPYTVRTAREVERTLGAALPDGWRPEAPRLPEIKDADEAAVAPVAQGVLDAEASAVAAASATDEGPDWAALLPVTEPRSYPLWPWLAAAALALLVGEASRGTGAARSAGGARASPLGPDRASTPTKPTPTAAG